MSSLFNKIGLPRGGTFNHRVENNQKLVHTSVLCFKKQKQYLSEELKAGDCWIAVSLAASSGLILAARVGKHTDELIEELVTTSEGKTTCKHLNSDAWGGYERVLPPEMVHHIGEDKTQRLERTNGIVRQ